MKKFCFFILIVLVIAGCAGTDGPGGPASATVDITGTWHLTHGGDDFVNLRIWNDRNILRGEVVKYLGSATWTKFDVTEIKITGDDVQILITYPDYNTYAKMALRISPDGARLTGTITGPTYTRPFEIIGKKIPGPAGI